MKQVIPMVLIVSTLGSFNLETACATPVAQPPASSTTPEQSNQLSPEIRALLNQITVLNQEIAITSRTLIDVHPAMQNLRNTRQALIQLLKARGVDLNGPIDTPAVTEDR